MKRHSMEKEAIIEKEEKGKKEENINKEEILRKLETEGKAVVETFSPEETFLLGELLGGRSRAGEVYTFSGDLGAGKTVFTQGFARGLGISEPVNSPTFTILQMYEGGRLPLYHFDVYRVAGAEEMDEIGYEDCIYGEGVCLIEWAELIGEILPQSRIEIDITRDPLKGFDYRRIEIAGWEKVQVAE